MGTWDIGFFDNDMACDWENEIKEIKTLSHIEDTLKPVIENKDESLDIDLANRALAGAEALARLLLNDGEHNSYTKHLDRWVKEFNNPIPDKLLNLALKSLDKVLSSESELLQFWKIRGEYNNWSKNIHKLKERLIRKDEK